MCNKIQGPSFVSLDYVEKHKAMSSKSIVVDLYWQEKCQFAFRVNEHVFNPIESITAHKLVDLVLSEKIEVADKSVIDLGCGSGVIGFTAILKGAKRVLFTDINPCINGIQNHPLFREVDEVKVQNILESTSDSSYDLVLALPPALEASPKQNIASDTYETGIFRPSEFYAQVIVDSGRVLKPGGQLVIWLRIPLASFHVFLELLAIASELFDIQSRSLLANGIESLIHMDHEKSRMTRWFYRFKKGGVLNDGLWLFLSLTKKREKA